MDQEFFGDADGSHPKDSNAFDYSQSMASIHPAGVWGNMAHYPANLGVGVHPTPPPSLVQSIIVSNCKAHVSQVFGQITPPEDMEPNSASAPSLKLRSQQRTKGGPVKLSKEQRARVAANTRHYKAPKKKKDSKNDNNSCGEEEGSKSQGKNAAVQREKNRIAAAKCRAKKKAVSKVRVAQHREEAARNSFLTREQRELRNEKIRLQNLILAHRPGVCECHGLHRYNTMQAQRLALEAEVHGGHAISLPSQETASSAQTLGSDMLVRRMSTSGLPVPLGGMAISPRQHRFNDAVNYAFT